MLECGTVITATEPETRPHANMVLLCMVCMCATAYQNNAIVNSLENKWHNEYNTNLSVTPSESDQALKFTQFGNSLDIGTLSLMALDNSLDIAKNVFSSPYTTIKSPKQRQWNRNMIGGGGGLVSQNIFFTYFFRQAGSTLIACHCSSTTISIHY